MNNALQRIPFKKIAIVGDPAVGKTSLIVRTVLDTFSPKYNATIGVDFFTKRIRCENSAIIDLQLWDMAGQDRETFMRIYSHNSSIVVLAYDPTRDPEGSSLDEWKKIVVDHLRSNKPDLQYFVIATKGDLLKEDYLSKFELIKLRFPDSSGFLITSAQERINVKEFIDLIAKLVMPGTTAFHEIDMQQEVTSVGGLTVINGPKQSQKSSECCLTNLFSEKNDK